MTELLEASLSAMVLASPCKGQLAIARCPRTKSFIIFRKESAALQKGQVHKGV